VQRCRKIGKNLEQSVISTTQAIDTAFVVNRDFIFENYSNCGSELPSAVATESRTEIYRTRIATAMR
jgi:hypothetical protein